MVITATTTTTTTSTTLPFRLQRRRPGNGSGLRKRPYGMEEEIPLSPSTSTNGSWSHQPLFFHYCIGNGWHRNQAKATDCLAATPFTCRNLEAEPSSEEAPPISAIEIWHSWKFVFSNMWSCERPNIWMFLIYRSYKNAIAMKSFKFSENELTLHDMILVVTEFMNTINK